MKFVVLLLATVFPLCLSRSTQTANERLVYYFFSDVYPSLHNGHRPLDPPQWWRRIFEGRPAQADPEPEPTAMEEHIPPVAAAAPHAHAE
jgi:hypothetical protein